MFTIMWRKFVTKIHSPSHFIYLLFINKVWYFICFHSIHANLSFETSGKDDSLWNDDKLVILSNKDIDLNVEYHYIYKW